MLTLVGYQADTQNQNQAPVFFDYQSFKSPLKQPALRDDVNRLGEIGYPDFNPLKIGRHGNKPEKGLSPKIAADFRPFRHHKNPS